MRLQDYLYPCAAAVLIFVAGCATDLSLGEPQAPTHVVTVTHEQARQLAFSYRRQAADLRDLVRRMETEASLFAGRAATSSAQSQGRALQVAEVWAAAENADELARAYQRQIPHGQLQ